eukprot:Gb_05180 [translate_table: standard]
MSLLKITGSVGKETLSTNEETVSREGTLSVFKAVELAVKKRLQAYVGLWRTNVEHGRTPEKNIHQRRNMLKLQTAGVEIRVSNHQGREKEDVERVGHPVSSSRGELWGKSIEKSNAIECLCETGTNVIDWEQPPRGHRRRSTLGRRHL